MRQIPILFLMLLPFSGCNSIFDSDAAEKPKEYTISITITGTHEPVLLVLSGDAQDSVTVGPGGTHAFRVREQGTYTITPSNDCCTFSPPRATYSRIESDQTQTFTGSMSEAMPEDATDTAGDSMTGGTSGTVATSSGGCCY